MRFILLFSLMFFVGCSGSIGIREPERPVENIEPQAVSKDVVTKGRTTIRIQTGIKTLEIESIYSMTCSDDTGMGHCLAREWVRLPRNQSANYYLRELIKKSQEAWKPNELAQREITASEFETVFRAFNGPTQTFEFSAEFETYLEATEFKHQIGLQRCRSHPVVKHARANPIRSQGNFVFFFPNIFAFDRQKIRINSVLEWSPVTKEFEYWGAYIGQDWWASNPNAERYGGFEVSFPKGNDYILFKNPRIRIDLNSFQSDCREYYPNKEFTDPKKNLAEFGIYYIYVPPPGSDKVDRAVSEGLPTELLVSMTSPAFMENSVNVGVSHYRKFSQKILKLYQGESK